MNGALRWGGNRGAVEIGRRSPQPQNEVSFDPYDAVLPVPTGDAQCLVNMSP